MRDKVYTRVGTLEFYPVEMLSPFFPESPIKPTYDERVDIWSMGVVLYELLYGKTPFFTAGNEEETKKKIRSMKFDFLRPGVFIEAEHLFRKIFVAPQERISLKEIQRHKWLVEEIPDAKLIRLI